MSDGIAYVIAGLLLIQAFFRARAALKGWKRDRSLWGAFVAFAAAWLSRTTHGRDLLNNLGIPDLAYFVKHALTIAGICVILRYVTAVYRSDGFTRDLPRSVRISAIVHRVATKASVATVAVMGLVFVFLLNDPDTSTPFFLDRHRGEAGVLVYMGLFYLYVGATAAVCAVQWGGAVRRAPIRSLRIGLRMMTAGMVLAVLYAILRTAYLPVITFSSVSESANLDQERVTDTLLYLSFLLWGFGTIAPAARAGRERISAVRGLLELYPLWRSLALWAPEVVRHRASTLFSRRAAKAGRLDTVRDLFFSPDPSPPAHLARWAMDIRDVIAELRRQVPADLAERALVQAEAELKPEHGTDVQAEALWLRAAVSAERRRTEGTATSSAPYPFGPGQDRDQGDSAPGHSLREELEHLRTVASAFRITSLSDGRALLVGHPADHV
ncbi:MULTISPECIES: DUF6545 domain-containing protein [Streptomyces]|uniref:DUF6545 domain-containing protein n=1 Tax=Streptomyces zinciresistens K42 TaxID=700597 RepID=G2G741_9ACTN|nr:MULTISPECIES: DUF6545 domain-containing protein [Streptomyces]EGX60582.1 hypothetical protein SZN_06516 [Streptomyces zinciresistens K42]MDT9695948.1 hypothetical protein [Streptomyces sp. P17]